MTKKYKTYSEEFKRDALRLLETSEKTQAQIEQDLGLTPSLLGKWKKRYQINDNSKRQEPTLERSDIEALKAENRRLKKELETVKQEREILKKAAIYFANDRS
jgi:transposase